MGPHHRIDRSQASIYQSIYLSSHPQCGVKEESFQRDKDAKDGAVRHIFEIILNRFLATRVAVSPFIRHHIVNSFKMASYTTSTSNLIDGTSIAKTIREELKETVDILKETHGVTPGLAVVLVGERKDSATYVRMKKRACDEIGMSCHHCPLCFVSCLLWSYTHFYCFFVSSILTVPSYLYSIHSLGIRSIGIDLPAECTQDELVSHVQRLNADTTIHGILIQLPLPPHIDEQTVLNCISQCKDVDGLHPLNVANLANTKTHAPGKSTWSFDSIDFHVSCMYILVLSPLLFLLF